MTGDANSQANLDRVKAVKSAYGDELMSKANVVGVGVGFLHRGGMRTSTIALVVMVEKKVPGSQLAPSDMIPAEIEGVPVDVQEVGQISAQG
jgi:hypothetical protein